MKSEFRQFEVFITSDGEEFICDLAAQDHQDYIDSKAYIEDHCDVDIESLISNGYDFLKESLNEYEHKNSI